MRGFVCLLEKDQIVNLDKELLYVEERFWCRNVSTYNDDKLKKIRTLNVCVRGLILEYLMTALKRRHLPNWTNNFGRTFSCHEAHKFPTMQCSNITLIIIINLLT